MTYFKGRFATEKSTHRWCSARRLHAHNFDGEPKGGGKRAGLGFGFGFVGFRERKAADDLSARNGALELGHLPPVRARAA